MSRSKRKHPIVKDNKKAKKDKIIANKKFRRKYHYNTNDEDILSNNKYKRFYEHWLIHDWRCRLTEQNYLVDWFKEEVEELNTGEVGYLHNKYKSIKEYLKGWKTDFLYK